MHRLKRCLFVSDENTRVSLLRVDGNRCGKASLSAIGGNQVAFISLMFSLKSYS